MNSNDIKSYPTVLLVGNGINRAYGVSSWDDLISKIKTREVSEDEATCIEKMPYPLRPIVLTEDNVCNKMKDIAEDLCSFQPADEEVTMLHEVINLQPEAILTTNYTYEIEKTMCSEFKCKVGRPSKFRKKVQVKAGKSEIKHLHTYFSASEDGPSIWHIHGDAAIIDTMVLGHYQYGKLLSKMQQYVPKLLARYKSAISKGHAFKYSSWMDYFLLGNVYIIGLGMDLSEMDLWWLVNCKKRNFSCGKTVLFKHDIKTEERLLAETYGVEVVTEGFKDKEYKNYYKWIINEIKEREK